MTAAEPIRVTPKLIAGLGILCLGILWTLDNMDLIESEPITRWWPAVLILTGISQVVARRGQSRSGWPWVLVVVGTVFLVDRLDIANISFGDLIPLAIALLGAKLIWEALTRGRRAEALGKGDPDSTVNAFAMMAGLRHQSVSPTFRGGDANAIMGGVELDLREAKVASGVMPVLDTFAMWGGIEITVPPNWKVTGNVLPLMGSFEDNTRHNGEPGPTLTVRGTAVMGAVEVKN